MIKYLVLLCVPIISFCYTLKESCEILREYAKIKQFQSGDGSLVGIEQAVDECINGDENAYNFVQRALIAKEKNDLFDVAIVEQAADDNDLAMVEQKASRLLKGIVHNCHHITEKPDVFCDYVKAWILSGKLRLIIESKYTEKQHALAVIRASHKNAKL